jgi:hypothetical protein
MFNETNKQITESYKKVVKGKSKGKCKLKPRKLVKENVDRDLIVVEQDFAYESEQEFWDFVKKGKKYGIKVLIEDPEGPGGGWPVLTMFGKRDNMKKFLSETYLDGREFDWNNTENWEPTGTTYTITGEIYGFLPE